jgi:hypothetical protein
MHRATVGNFQQSCQGLTIRVVEFKLYFSIFDAFFSLLMLWRGIIL